MGSFFCQLCTCIFYFLFEKLQVIKDIASYNPPITFHAILLDLTSRGTKSPDSCDAITTIYVDICLEFHFFIFFIESNFIERSHLEEFTGNIKKLILNAGPKS